MVGAQRDRHDDRELRGHQGDEDRGRPDRLDRLRDAAEPVDGGPQPGGRRLE